MIDFVEGGINVRNGFAGHPKFVEGSDVVNLYIVDEEDVIEEIVEFEYIKVT
jgi:hypothetical protein